MYGSSWIFMANGQLSVEAIELLIKSGEAGLDFMLWRTLILTSPELIKAFAFLIRECRRKV